MKEDELSNLYKQVNCKKRPCFVYHLGGEAGFFSEYNNMILSILYCLENEIQFNLYSKDANFKYQKGWSDYFQPFCEETGNLFHHFFNRRTNDRFKKSVVRKVDRFLTNGFCRLNPDVLTMYDLWDDIRSLSIDSVYDFPSFGLKGDLRFICQQLIKMTWVYNKQTENAVSQLRQGINLTVPYVGFHIRSGDKFIETDLLNCKLYIEKAERLSGIRTAFVLTDDYAVITNLLTNFPHWSFYTLCKKDETGYFHGSFKQEKPMIKKERFIKLFASMDILAEAEIFIGTYSSNPGMYLGMRMSSSKVYSIDIPEWCIW